MKYLDLVNVSVMLVSALIGARRYKLMDKATRIFFILVASDFITESIAFYAGRKYHNNMPVYSIYSLIEFMLICIYFNKSIDVFRTTNAGIFIGIAGVILGILNIILLQPLNQLNTYFLFFEGIVIIVLSLLSILRWLLKEEQPILYEVPNFWLSILLAFFWSVTFLSWGLYDFFSIRLGSNWIIDIVILIINIVLYTGVSIVFIRYPKMRQYER